MHLAIIGIVLLGATELPMGWAPAPLSFPHFPDRLHAIVWRNWQLVPPERMAEVIGGTPKDLLDIGYSMGLSDPPRITEEQLHRTYITILRRNWHLMPYEQLCALVKWTPEEMAYTLREGDGLFWWFGSYKPQVEPLRYEAPSDAAKQRAAEIAAVVRDVFPAGIGRTEDPLFSFIEKLSDTSNVPAPPQAEYAFAPRFCYSYYAPFRDPLSGKQDPWPDGYLARLASMGVDGVILHEPLFHFAEFPWDPSFSEGREERLERLREIVARGKRHGIGVFLYINEPRPMPMSFFEKHPELKGVDDNVLVGQQANLCTSIPEVRDYLRNGIRSLCEAVPDLGGIFTITASENLTNCWSHGFGDKCPRCAKRTPQEVIAEVNACMAEGIAASGSACRFIAWDWGWSDDWAQGIIERLPQQTNVMSVSEWSIPIERGGVKSVVGEYSLSTIGPGPRAARHWGFARERGLKTIAKIQMSNCWELAAVPYVPVVENVGQHMANLRDANVNGLMLSWTLGCYPSPSFDVVSTMCRKDAPTVDQAMLDVATRRFGAASAPAVVEAWRAFSAAYREYPFHITGLYCGPQHMGPANLLWGEPTGYKKGTMAFAFPVDDLDTWRSVYPAEAYIGQFAKVAGGFERAIAELEAKLGGIEIADADKQALNEEIAVAQACAVHFRSVANQGRFVVIRDELNANPAPENAGRLLDEAETILKSESDLASRLWAIQNHDARIGFEAACQYFYVGADLAEKVVNCRDLLTRWLPAQRARFANKG